VYSLDSLNYLPIFFFAGVTIGFNTSVIEVEKGSPVTVCAESYSESLHSVFLNVRPRQGTAGNLLIFCFV